MITDAIWAMEPTAMTLIQRQLSGVEAIRSAADIQAGASDIPTCSVVDDAARAGLPVRRQGSTAMVSLSGPMLRRVGIIGRILGFTGTLELQRAIEAADADEDIRDIVILADTPGGSVQGLTNLADAIGAASKPTTVVVEGMLASAGLFVGAQADRIVMEPDAMIGSIGTILVLLDASRAFEEMGVEVVSIDTGEFKGAGILGTEITENQRADFQRIVDGFFGKFVNSVQTGRNMSRDDVLALADGRMFLAEEATKNGLADTIQKSDDFLAGLRQRNSRTTRTARAQLEIMKRRAR